MHQCATRLIRQFLEYGCQGDLSPIRQHYAQAPLTDAFHIGYTDAQGAENTSERAKQDARDAQQPCHGAGVLPARTAVAH